MTSNSKSNLKQLSIIIYNLKQIIISMKKGTCDFSIGNIVLFKTI